MYFTASLTLAALNTMICHYIGKNRKIPRLLKSRYSENMVISIEDIACAEKYGGYTIETYMYLQYYSKLVMCGAVLSVFIFY